MAGAPQPQAAAKKKKDPKAHKMYEISGGSIKAKNRSCPKCGAGTYLANHKDRATCGACGYTEFKGKKV
jgi:ubiquitin-small subunit ribosomal protein S27Ae